MIVCTAVVRVRSTRNIRVPSTLFLKFSGRQVPTTPAPGVKTKRKGHIKHRDERGEDNKRRYFFHLAGR